MRARLALLLLLLFSTPLFAQADRVLARHPADDFDLEVKFGARRLIDPRCVVIEIQVDLPAEQLRYVDDGNELAARLTILVVQNNLIVGQDAHRVAAPRGTAPVGTLSYRFEILAEPGPLTLAVFDEHSGYAATRALVVDGTVPRLAAMPEEGPAADATWRDALVRAKDERKPIVVLFRVPDCHRCRELTRASVPHPAIARRLPSVVFAALPARVGEASKLWGLKEPGVGLFDRSGVLRARWRYVPDTTDFGVILDSAIALAPQLEQAVQLAEAGRPAESAIEVAVALARLGRPAEARAALARVVDGDAKPRLFEAWMAIGNIHRAAGAINDASRAFTFAVATAERGSPEQKAAREALDNLRAPREGGRSVAIRILPLSRQIVSGRQAVKTHVASAAVARVAFSLDGREVRRVERPPFSLTLDFGEVPERHAIRAVAFDRKGNEIGRDERIVNEAGETFWLRLTEPRGGLASGRTRVAMSVRLPVAQRLQRVTISWNDAERAVLRTAPWETTIDIPIDQVGVLRAVAELDDGRTSEDAVLLNAGGFVDQANVQLVELPITVLTRDGSTPPITADRIKVREGNKTRRVESVATASDTPLTVGLLIDASASMQKTIPDVQEAAIRFLETILGPRDRAFLVTFDTHARLVQPATSNVTALRKQIMRIRPDELTALHDAMALGLLQFEGIKGRRAMIVFSDGLDRTSRYDANDVAELARRVNVPVHVIASIPGVPAASGSTVSVPSNASAADDELQPIARATGGTSHTLNNLAELPNVYARIEAALRAQILAFVRTDAGTKENEWRGIRVHVEGRELEVHAPEGYYASW